MSATGFLQVHAFTSSARLPLEDVAIAVTADDGTALALRLTDSSGLIEPIPIPVPDRSESQEPHSGQAPFTTVNLYARLQGYEQIEAEHLQLFAGVTTEQDLQMIPLPELPDSQDRIQLFDTPPQNL